MEPKLLFTKVNAFVYHNLSYLFTAIEVFHIEESGSSREFYEIHVGDTGIWTEFSLPIINKNLSRLTENYLVSVINHYKNYQDQNSDEEDSEAWAEMLNNFQAELDRRKIN